MYVLRGPAQQTRKSQGCAPTPPPPHQRSPASFHLCSQRERSVGPSRVPGGYHSRAGNSNLQAYLANIPGPLDPWDPIQPKPRADRAHPYSTRKKTRAVQRFKQFIVPQKGRRDEGRPRGPRPERLFVAHPKAEGGEWGKAAVAAASLHTRAWPPRGPRPGRQARPRPLAPRGR